MATARPIKASSRPVLWMLGTLGTSLALAAIMLGGPATSQAQTQPKTAFQCKKAYKRGSRHWRQNRAACLKRLLKEKPGISCKHPLESGVAADGVSIGDLKDYTVKLKFMNPGAQDGPEPQERIFEAEVTIHNPRVIICGMEVGEVVSEPKTFIRVKHIFHPTISPHGGLSSPFKQPLSGVVLFGVRVFARYE